MLRKKKVEQTPPVEKVIEKELDLTPLLNKSDEQIKVLNSIKEEQDKSITKLVTEIVKQLDSKKDNSQEVSKLLETLIDLYSTSTEENKNSNEKVTQLLEQLTVKENAEDSQTLKTLLQQVNLTNKLLIKIYDKVKITDSETTKEKGKWEVNVTRDKNNLIAKMDIQKV